MYILPTRPRHYRRTDHTPELTDLVVDASRIRTVGPPSFPLFFPPLPALRSFPCTHGRWKGWGEGSSSAKWSRGKASPTVSHQCPSPFPPFPPTRTTSRSPIRAPSPSCALSNSAACEC